jgi:hypothetical protein
MQNRLKLTKLIKTFLLYGVPVKKRNPHKTSSYMIVDVDEEMNDWLRRKEHHFIPHGNFGGHEHLQGRDTLS